MKRKRVGLALGGGAARGLVHIGVLEVLEEAGIKIDMIAGTSAGAVIGSLYAQGRSARQISQIATEQGSKRLNLIDPSLPRTGLIGGRRIKNLLVSYIGRDTQFSDLKTPFACVATDILTGEEVVFTEGPVIEAVRASISIPAVLTLVKLGGKYLVDGGLSNPVPVSVVKSMGADFIIAVNVIPHVDERASHLKLERARHPEPNIIQVVMQSIYIGTYFLTMACLDGADTIIEPYVAKFGPGDFHHAEAIMYRADWRRRSRSNT